MQMHSEDRCVAQLCNRINGFQRATRTSMPQSYSSITGIPLNEANDGKNVVLFMSTPVPIINSEHDAWHTAWHTDSPHRISAM